MTPLDAMKQALEALEVSIKFHGKSPQCEKAITNLRAAIEQYEAVEPQHERWMCENDVWKESYEELERLAREQVAKLERSANTAWEQVRLADNNLILATNALRSIQSHAIGSAYILMVCNDALRKIEGDRPHPAPAVPEGWKLVPIEPTLQMLDALRANTTPNLEKRYKTMLNAAPEYKEQV